jgi:peptidoglycan/LPS O-acetylase OafA/YrhL
MIKNRIFELDALRGIAALMVVLFHCTLKRPDDATYLRFGTTGVDLFFIISGFVIFNSIQNKTSYLDFLYSRISRLYPTYIACVIFTFSLVNGYDLYKTGAINFSEKGYQLLTNLTMFQYYFGTANIDGPYWTMIIEMTFYLFIALIFRFKWISYVNTTGIILSIFSMICFHFCSNNFFIEKMLWAFPLLSFAPLFFSGIIFYELFHNKSNSTYSQYAMLVVLFFLQVALFPYVGHSKKHITQIEYASTLGVYFLIFVLLVKNKLGFITNKITLFLGKISFALYLVHQAIAQKFIIPTFHNKLGLNFWIVVFFVVLPVVIAIATIITYKIEIPCSKKLRATLLKTRESV